MLALVGTVMSRSASGKVLLRDGDRVLGTHKPRAYSAHGAIKGGLVVLTRYLAKELSPASSGSTPSPGTTRTAIADNAFARHPEAIPAAAAGIALGRIGEPDDVGVLDRGTPPRSGRWITAQNIEVSGGQNL